MAKHVLNSGGDDFDFELIGISTPENQYSIISLINSALSIDLSLSDNIPFNLKDGKLFYFSLFNYTNDELGLEYFFISNKSNLENDTSPDLGSGGLFADMKVQESTRLVKELPRTDYFLILKGEELHMFRYKILDILKTIDEIVQVQKIEPAELPSRMNLVF